MAEKHDQSDLSAEAEKPQIGIIREMVDFLLDNQKWWLIPIIVTLLMVGLLIVVGGSAAAPFIYAMF